ncbi:MAG: hypothetical protein L0G96_01590 [Acinetobacter sp.]|nr:hypothetical protein [Acinetobacter sp.]
MINFSEANQAFYDLNLNYEPLPEDLVEVTSDEHIELLGKLNDGHYVFSDLSYTEKKPSIYHTWDGSDWVDNRTDEEKHMTYLSQFISLTRRQFKLALLENGLLATVEQMIESIEDPTIKARIKIEYIESERFERTNDSVKYMLGVLDLTSDQVDDMWRYAMTL